MADPRHSGAYVMARRRFIAAHPPGTPCVLCGLPIDTTLSGNDPRGPSVEHTMPVRHYPEHALDVTLWRLCHRRCNNQQGGRVARDGRSSRQWDRPPERRW